MKYLVTALALAVISTSSSAQEPAAAAPSAPPAVPYSTATTKIGDLIANPETKAVFDRHLPGFSENPQMQQARDLTLRQVQQFAPQFITTQVLDAMDADLARIPRG